MSARTPTRPSKERDVFMSPSRKSVHPDAPRTPNIVERVAAQCGAGSSGSPRTPRTRSETRSETRSSQENDSFSYQTPDLDSIMHEAGFSQVYDYRSPTATKDDMVRERPFSLFSPPDQRIVRHCMTPQCAQSPSWPFSSPGLSSMRMPSTPDFARSPGSHFMHYAGLRREPLARPLLHDTILMAGLPEGHYHQGFPVPTDSSKRPRKEKREKKTPTSTAPKRGQYRCGKCGFFPKKQKHNCATEKQKRPTPDPKMSAPFPMEVPMMNVLPHMYFS